MKKEDLRADTLQKFGDLITENSKKARELLLELPYQNDAYLVACIALTYRDEAMFFNNGKRRKKFLPDKLQVAKKYIDASIKLNAVCRESLFIKGTIYNALGDTLTAIDCYIHIIEFAERKQKKYNCLEADAETDAMVINDAHFQLYRLFHDLENYKLSLKFLKAYRKELKKGIPSIYHPPEDFLMDSTHL